MNIFARIFLLMLVLLVVPAAPHAQEDIAGQIVEADENTIVLKNGRSYTLVNSILIENMGIQALRGISNFYDFENSFMIHRGNVIPFSDLPGGRIAELRDYGCYIVTRVSAVNRKPEMERFFEDNCLSASVIEEIDE